VLFAASFYTKMVDIDSRFEGALLKFRCVFRRLSNTLMARLGNRDSGKNLTSGLSS